MKCLVYLQTAEQQLFHAAESNDVQLAKHALDLHNVANIVNRVRIPGSFRLRMNLHTRAHSPAAPRAHGSR